MNNQEPLVLYMSLLFGAVSMNIQLLVTFCFRSQEQQDRQV